MRSCAQMGQGLAEAEVQGLGAFLNGGALFCRVFASYQFAFAWHGDAAFARVAPTGGDVQIGCIRVQCPAANTSDRADGLQLPTKRSTRDTFNRVFGVEQSGDLAADFCGGEKEFFGIGEGDSGPVLAKGVRVCISVMQTMKNSSHMKKQFFRRIGCPNMLQIVNCFWREVWLREIRLEVLLKNLKRKQIC